MSRFRFALVLLMGLAVPGQVLAQASNNVTIYKNGDRVMNPQGTLFVTSQDCTDNIPFKFELRLESSAGGNLRNRFLQAWTAGTNLDCTDPGNRDDPNGDSCEAAPCDRKARQVIMNVSDDLTMTINAQELFGDGGSCATGGTTRVTFVAVENENCTTDSAPNNLFTVPYNATFELRTTPAIRPTDVKIADGDTTLATSWKAEGSQSTDTFTVFVDTDPGEVCSNSMLMEGMPLSEAETLADMVDELVTYTTRSKSYDLLTERLGVEVGGFVAVFVANEDQAGNTSDLSEMVCGERIATEGVIGAVERASGKGVQSCSGGGRGAAEGSAAALLGLLGLWLVRRRGSRA